MQLGSQILDRGRRGTLRHIIAVSESEVRASSGGDMLVFLCEVMSILCSY